MKSNRTPSETEKRIISYLVERAGYPNSDCLRHLKVEEMIGGNGSLRLIPDGLENTNRFFGAKVSDVWFNDTDGMWVNAALNVDKEGLLLELDIWRVDNKVINSYSNLFRIMDGIEKDSLPPITHK